MTNLDLSQHQLEPIKVVESCPSLLDNQLSAPRAILPLVLNVCHQRSRIEQKVPIKAQKSQAHICKSLVCTPYQPSP